MSSRFHIGRTVERISRRANPYTSLIEVVVNAIEAIEESKKENGEVNIRVIRSGQMETEGRLRRVEGFQIRDNGIGFNDTHLKSFDTLYTDQKMNKGGKGFGRFVCLRDFNDVKIESVYQSNCEFKSRKFTVGREYDMITKLEEETAKISEEGSTVLLTGPRGKTSFDLRVDTIAKVLIQNLLPFFISEGYKCPKIVLSEQDGGDTVILNSFFDGDQKSFIEEINVEDGVFRLPLDSPREAFRVRVFKLYEPRNIPNRISLVAHRRAADTRPLKSYIPEFAEPFIEEDGRRRNYVINAYVFSEYLDQHVSTERSRFNFSSEPDLYSEGIDLESIEKKVAEIVKDAVGTDYTNRREKKIELVRSYVNEKAPWYKSVLEQIDFSKLPVRPTDTQIETLLHDFNFGQETKLQKKLDRVIESMELDTVERDLTDLVKEVSDSSKRKLAQYIIFRKSILELFRRSLEKNNKGKYMSEGTVHDIIFPRKGHTGKTAFEDHNLWLIDERLNFTNHVASDLPFGDGDDQRPDLIAFNQRCLFRGDNEPSNPIMIFEFKKPGRHDFVNFSAKDDPVSQLIRYCRKIRGGKAETLMGREIHVTEGTPIYGFILCDSHKEVKEWLEEQKDFDPMPDRLGWFTWRSRIKFYIEVLTWDKVLKDAEIRNKIFFDKLGMR